jgi:cytochrome P450
VPPIQGVPSLAEEFDALVTCRPDLIADPYPFYRSLREEAPVYRHADQVVVSSFDDVTRVFRRRSSNYGAPAPRTSSRGER